MAGIRQTGSDGAVEGGGVKGEGEAMGWWQEVHQALPDGAV